MNKKFIPAFTLIELMIVVAIIAFLAMMAIPAYLKFVARAKRTEAQINLASLYAAEKAYWAEHGTYTDMLMGPNGLGWHPEGKMNYSYGFAGAVGTNNLKGALDADPGAFSAAHADKSGFTAIAAADIDGDGMSDILTINEKNEMSIKQDDLQTGQSAPART